MPSIVLRLSQKKQSLPVSSTSPNMDNHVARSGVGPARMKNTNAPTTTMTGSTAATGYHDDEGDDDDDAHLLVRHQEEKHGDAPSADDEERSKQKNQNIHVSSTTTTTTSPRINPTSALPVSNRITINNHTVHPTGVLVGTDMIDHAQNYEECLSNKAHDGCTDATLSHHKLNDGEHEEDRDYSKGHDANSRKRGLVSTDSLFSSPAPKKYFPRHSGGTAPPRRQYAVQEKSTSAASSVTSENTGTTNFNDNMDPRNSTTSSVPFPAASPSVSSSSSVQSTRGGIGASGYKNKHGTRRNSELLSSQTRQPTGVVLPEKFHLRKSVSAAGQNLKGYDGGDNNQHIRSVGGDSCMENNEAVPSSPYAAQYSSYQPPFFDMVQHHPYLVQPSSANSFTLLPSGAATAVHHLPPNGFYYSSDVSPQNVVGGAPHANLIAQHPDPHHSRRNSNSNGVHQAAYHGEGRDVSRSGTQVGVILPNHQSNNGMTPLSAGFNSAIPHTGASQNCQILYYVPHPSANTGAGPLVHDVVSPSVGGYYVQMPSVANNHMVSPAPTMSHINHVTGDNQRVYPGTQFPPPEYCLNHSYLPQQNQHNENNNATYFHSTQHGSRTSQKTNFDEHFPNNIGHNDAKELANNQHHHKEAMDDGTAAGGGPFHQPADDSAATRKRILLTKLEEEKPRRPLTAYNFFFSEERERIIAEMSSKNAEDDATNLDSSLSDSPSLKNSGSRPSPHFSPEALVQTNEDNDDKITQEQTNINNNGLEEMIRAKTEKLLSSRRQCDRPKRSHKKEHGKVSFQVLCTLVGKRWKALSDEQKQYYVDLSKKDIQRYRMDMKDYARKRARAVETFGVDDAIEK